MARKLRPDRLDARLSSKQKTALQNLLDRAPYREAVKILEDSYGIKTSIGTLCRWHSEVRKTKPEPSIPGNVRGELRDVHKMLQMAVNKLDRLSMKLGANALEGVPKKSRDK